MRDTLISIILRERAQQGKDTSTRYVVSSTGNWRCGSCCHSKALHIGLYISTDTFFPQQYLRCATPICRAMFWGFSDVVVYLPKHTCYRIVQEISVYMCTIRNQWACSFLPVIFFCCE